MSDIPENQIADWLKKLEHESWQLELLVSAFTIFLLINATSEFEEYLLGLTYEYNLSTGGLAIVFIFLGLLMQSLHALTICLVGHLMLRGFWIGTIGLRSVQSSIDFSRLNYNEFFTEKLKKKVISLDQLVIKLDEICSVIFAFAFLVISMLIAFGLYLFLFGGVAILFNRIGDVIPDSIEKAYSIFAVGVFLTVVISGLVYMIDYFTLGFFKKIKWLRKIYYPFYKFYNVITLAILSRSIYYYLISKFTKRKIRIIYSIVGAVLLISILLSYDQYQYFPEEDNDYIMTSNYYDDLRPSEDYISKVSIESKFISKPHFQLFLRYDLKDNAIIRAHCPDFFPMKEDGLNWRLMINTDDGNFNIRGRDYSKESFDSLLVCQSSIYEISINDSVYQDLPYYFFRHPSKDQRGLITTIPTTGYKEGENILEVKKLRISSKDSTKIIKSRFARIPFWYRK